MTLRTNGSWDFLFDSQVARARVTWLGRQAISNAHWSHLFAWFAQPEAYIDTSILPNRARENPRRRQPTTAYPAGPVRPCIPVHVHASHIGGRSSSRMQKSGVGEGLRSRQVQPTLSVVEVARASVRQSHCTNAYRVLLFEFCDDVAVMMMHYVNLRKRLSHWEYK